MSQALTPTKLHWDSRPFSLTLAGCLTLAGLPLAAAAVADVMPEPQEREQDALEASCRALLLESVPLVHSSR